ncbi:MAG: ATP-binding protein [Candidatus Aminicenantales bacterium]
MINSHSFSLAVSGAKIGLAGLFFSSVFFLHFSSIFPRKISPFFDSFRRLGLYYLLPSFYLLFVFSSMDIKVEKIKELGNLYYYHHLVLDQPPSFYIFYLFLAGFILIFSLIGMRNLFSSLKNTTIAREKNQIKYLITGIALMVIFGVGIDLANYFFKFGFPVLFLFSTYSILISLFFAIAILKLHLLDIRFIIRGGLSYFVLSGVVLALYLLLVKNLGELVGKKTREGSIVVESLLIVLIVVLSRPLIKAMESGIDRIFYQGRYSLKRRIDEFHRFLVNEINLNNITKKVISFLKNQLHVKESSVFLFNKNLSQYEAVNDSAFFSRYSIPGNEKLIELLIKSKSPFEKGKLKSMAKESPAAALFLDKKVSLVLPLFNKEELIGIIFMGEKIRGKLWSQEELDLLSEFATHTAAAVSRAIMTDELKEAERAIAKSKKLIALGEFSAGIAHQIRNPLNIISASAETIEKDDIDSKTKKDIAKFIIDEANKLNSLVENFLNFARPGEPHISWCKVEDIVRNSINSVYDKALKQKIEFITKLEANLPLFHTDQQQLEQLIINLLLNGIEAMEEGGEIEISARSAGKENLVIEVKDSGKGISPEIEEEIFNPFFTTKERGVGLGLSIAARIAENLGGVLSFRSEPGKGSSFRIVLPVHRK